MPITLSHAVASETAPKLTGLTQDAHDEQRSVYGEAYPPGVTLDRTGTTKRTLRFTSSGTIVSCHLGTSYAKYLIRYGLLPNSKAAMPVEWTRAIQRILYEYKVPL